MDLHVGKDYALVETVPAEFILSSCHLSALWVSYVVLCYATHDQFQWPHQTSSCRRLHPQVCAELVCHQLRPPVRMCVSSAPKTER